jgi:16S rRNA (uracil1498-N3)-methyltransferase
MLRPRFFTAQPLAEGQSIALEKEPSRHIAKALRMQVGDALCLFDGSGLEARATISAIEKDRVRATPDTVASVSRESPLEVTLIVAVSRGDRMDTVVQKATELGVKTIWPLLSERAGVRLDGDRLLKKLGHWQRIAISACEQCGRNQIPEISAPAKLATVLQRAADTRPGLRLILHPAGEVSALAPQCDSLLLLVGPEGGFSEAEVSAAVAAGFHNFQLGPRILRTETAPLAALAVAQARWGDLSA